VEKSENQLKSWLIYWRNSLADSDRKKVDIYTDPISVDSYFIEKVPERHALFLRKVAGESISDKPISVVISPCSYKYRYIHAKAQKQREETVYPFWIPAKMDKSGNLSSDMEPYFVRDYLNPNPDSYFSISDIQTIDDLLKQFEFKRINWGDYWKTCEFFFAKVTGKNYEEFNVEDEKVIFVQNGKPRNLAKNIIGLYDHILGDDNDSFNFLDTIVLNSKEDRKSISKDQMVNNPDHVGHMSSEFPLSASQRESIFAYSNTDAGQVLAINGPPGTGKTTLLQSVVATSVVSSVYSQKEPELIVASSANNQAITNILDSFNLDSDSLLERRWITGLKSLGLYLSSIEGSEYPLFRNEFGDGFIRDFENSGEDHIGDFQKQFEKCFYKEDDSQKIKNHLFEEVKSRVNKIRKFLAITCDYYNIREYLNTNGFKDQDELLSEIELKNTAKTNIIEYLTKLNKAESRLDEARKGLSVLDKILFFLPKVKEKRFFCFKRAVLDIEIEESIDYSDYSALLHQINKSYVLKEEQKESIVSDLSKYDSLLKDIRNKEERYKEIIEEWDNTYPEKLTHLYRKTGDEYKDLNPLEDVNIRLDISFRSEAFWLSIHYREIEYLLQLEENSKNAIENKERGYKTYKEKLRRISKITPIFISTFFSLPKFSSFFYKEVHPYYDLYDLLIVDEAGQVSPDVSIASFSLAKKALIVGDIFQIKPVWSIEEGIDICQLEKQKLLSEQFTEDEYDTLKTSGKLASSGSLMQMAQNACLFIENELPGVLLKEHRRCLDSIISYSNDFVYNKQLIPKVGNSKPGNLELPIKGYLHIDSYSQKSGSSRINELDATVIANWINENYLEFENVLNKEIKDILAIVTPYKSQAIIIRKQIYALRNKKLNEIKVGTVHVLQGAERNIVIFSSVLSPGDSTNFINSSYNMINVAISRAKHSFLIFGNLNVFDPKSNSPLGNLKKWLFSEEKNELSNEILYKNNLKFKKVERYLDSLATHRAYLNRAFKSVKNELIIVSPFISINAINTDHLQELAISAVEKNVKIKVYTDSALDLRKGVLKTNALKGRNALKRCGVELIIAESIHNKTLIIDDNVIIEGSFNWLSAARDVNNEYHRHETSICIVGEDAKPFILKAKEFLKTCNTLK
jgi:hypothetical protein